MKKMVMVVYPTYLVRLGLKPEYEMISQAEAKRRGIKKEDIK